MESVFNSLEFSSYKYRIYFNYIIGNEALQYNITLTKYHFFILSISNILEFCMFLILWNTILMINDHKIRKHVRNRSDPSATSYLAKTPDVELFEGVEGKMEDACRGKIVAGCSLCFFFFRVKDKRADRRKDARVGGWSWHASGIRDQAVKTCQSRHQMLFCTRLSRFWAHTRSVSTRNRNKNRNCGKPENGPCWMLV